MILKQIEMVGAELDFMLEEVNPLDYQVRSLLHFLNRSLKKQRISSEYNRIYIHLVKNVNFPPLLNDKTLEICIPFTIEDYNKFPLQELNIFLNKGMEVRNPKKIREFRETCFPEESFKQLPVKELNEYFISLLFQAISVAEEKFSIPAEAIIQAVNEFRDNNYRNCWTIKTRSFYKRRYKISVECELRFSDFFATLKLFKGEELIFSDRALRTPPTEFSFYHLIRNPVLKEIMPKVAFVELGGHTYRKDLCEYLT